MVVVLAWVVVGGLVVGRWFGVVDGWWVGGWLVVVVGWWLVGLWFVCGAGVSLFGVVLGGRCR